MLAQSVVTDECETYARYALSVLNSENDFLIKLANFIHPNLGSRLRGPLVKDRQELPIRMYTAYQLCPPRRGINFTAVT